MQADAINTVLNLSSAIHDLSRATEHATGEEGGVSTPRSAACCR